MDRTALTGTAPGRIDRRPVEAARPARTGNSFGPSLTIFFTRCHCSSSLSDSCGSAGFAVAPEATPFVRDSLLSCAGAKKFALGGATAESFLLAGFSAAALIRCHCSSSLSDSGLGCAADTCNGLKVSWPRMLCRASGSCCTETALAAGMAPRLGRG